MKLLVTGNLGFIAQTFVHMYKDKHEIIGIDARRYASDDNALTLCNTVNGDISNPLDLDTLFNNFGPFDVIVHMAAESHVDNSIKSPRPFINTNIVGTFELLEKMRQNGAKKFVLISTDEIFGDLMPNDPPFSNLHQLKPSSPYSASKASADLLALAYKRTYGLDVVITRGCNTYGKFQYYEKLLPVIISNAINDRPIPIYGTGLNQREWIFSEDHCRGIMAALEKGKSGSIYNLGSSIELTNLDMVKKILDIMGKPHSLIKFVEDRKGHDFRYFMDSSLAHEELGWKAKVPLEEGLKTTIDWYIQNPNYWSTK